MWCMGCLVFSVVSLAGPCNLCTTRNCTWSTAANFRAVIGIFLLQLHDIKISGLFDCVGGIALCSSIKLFDSPFLALVHALSASSGLQEFSFYDSVVSHWCAKRMVVAKASDFLREFLGLRTKWCNWLSCFGGLEKPL